MFRTGVSYPALASALAAVLLFACAQPAERTAPPPAAAAPDPAAPTPPPSSSPVARIPADAPPEPTPGPREPLQIQTAAGPVSFQVEFAQTESQRAKGLMFRRAMAPEHGMLFDFQESRPVFFWMRNTYIPLDMIFIDARGAIVAVASDTTPLSEAPVGPGVPVRAVLELNAGRAGALGIRAGDRVSHRIFAPR